MKIKLTWRIWLLIIVLALSLLSIFVTPNGIAFFQKGVLITSVESNSTAFEQGLRQGQIIIGIDEEKIDNLEDFSNTIQKKFPSEKSVIFVTEDKEIPYFSEQPPNMTVSEIPGQKLKLVWI